MPRNVPEWIGKTDSTPIPPRVKDRVGLEANWCCQKCNRSLVYEQVEIDHIIALINGGQNRESNLQLLCGWCHREKTKRDVKVKAKIYRIRRRRAGAVKRSRSSFATNKSGTHKRRMDGTTIKRRKG
jgi:5-methylcytosine-specific restriction endonuclease McrA